MATSSGIMPTGRLNRQNTQIEENVIEQLCGSRSTHWVRPFSSARLLSPRAAKLLIPMSSSIAWSRPIPLSLCYSLRADSFLYCSSGSAGDPCRDIAENDLKGKVNSLGLTVPICFLSELHFYHLMEGQRKDLFFIAMYAFSQAISLAVCSSGPASMPVADGQPAPELPTREARPSCPATDGPRSPGFPKRHAARLSPCSSHRMATSRERHSALVHFLRDFFFNHS